MEVLHHALVEGNQAFAVGIAQGWAVHSVKPRIVNQIVVALQGRDQLAQGLHAGKLRTDQRHELRSDSVPTAAATGLQKPLRPMTRNCFQKSVADRILMLHDSGSSAVSTTRKVV